MLLHLSLDGFIAWKLGAFPRDVVHHVITILAELFGDELPAPVRLPLLGGA